MGVVNVTPDSFSDGGEWLDPDAAVAHGLALVAEGADLVDVGGESTRPGRRAASSADEELRRVLPVVRGAGRRRASPSASTRCAPRSPRRRWTPGAALVNDVSRRARRRRHAARGRADAGVAVRRHALARAQRRRCTSGRSTTTCVRRGASTSCGQRLDALLGGRRRPRTSVVVDPGLGFAKTPSTTGRCWPGWTQLATLGRPVLVGASAARGSSGRLLAGPDGRAPHRRTSARTATAAVIGAGRRRGRVGRARARRTRQPRRRRGRRAPPGAARGERGVMA